MLRFSNGLISMILFWTVILIGYINNSYADIEIESVEVFPYADSYGTFTLYVYVQTSEPYVEINYYLDDTWIGHVPVAMVERMTISGMMIIVMKEV